VQRGKEIDIVRISTRFNFRLGLAAVAAWLTGCATMNAKTMFVTTESCPSDQVAVTSAAFRGWSGPALLAAPTIPPEVAADPARAAVYYRTHPPAVPNAGQPVLLAQGCGHTDMYNCENYSSDGHGGGHGGYFCTCMARIASTVGAGIDDFTKLTSMEATVSCIKVSENQYMNNGATPR
jgi:hypothetical protein